MSNSKKKVERYYLDRFSALLNNFPAGTVEESEEPDFLINGDRVVGIEFTELHRENCGEEVPGQAREAMRERVMARAGQLFDETGLPRVRCNAILTDEPIAKGSVEERAQLVAELAVRYLPSQPGGASIGRPSWENLDEFPDWISYISVMRLDGAGASSFHASGSTWVERLEAKHLEQPLVAKEKKLQAYRSRCDEAWLVIVVDAHRMSTWFSYDEELLPATVTSGFDRVFVLRLFGGGRVTELHPTRPDPAS